MFAVPGWNVSAPLIAQVEKPKPKDASKEGKRSKKRKRRAEEQVTESNLGELWNQAASGEKRVITQEQAFAAAKEGGKDADAGPPEKKRKKRNRKKAKKDTNEGDEEKDGTVDVEQQGSVEGTRLPVTTSDIVSPTADTEGQPTSPEKPKDAEQAKRNKKKRKEENRAARQAEKATTKSTPAVSLIPEPPGLTPMQKSMRTKLASARFRHLNESLYTRPSKESLALFTETPSMFEDYHRGFAQQVEVWPENPVDSYVTSILTRGKQHTKDPWKTKNRASKKANQAPPTSTEPETTPAPTSRDTKPLPRNLKGTCTIADLGCGTASLAHTLQPHLKALNLKIHSFDLAKPTGPSGPLVTVSDISALPLPPGTVDVAIFCLALMGTNWLAFIDEAYRVLRWRGELWVSEIKSRFGRVSKGQPPPNSVGLNRKPDKKAKKKKTGEGLEDVQDSADEAELATRVDGAERAEGTDVSAFVEVLKKRGFVLDALPERQGDAIDLRNRMFVKLQFVKGVAPLRGKNAKEGAEREGGAKMGHGIKGRKFAVVAEVDGAEEERDARVLKPCLYKVR